MNKLLILRKEIKSKKPEFDRQDLHKFPKLAKTWRRPKGLHSKIRLKRKGHIKRLEIGYKSPVPVRGLHPSGLKITLVSTPRQLDNVDKKLSGILISHGVGRKKRLEIMQKCSELNIKVLNVKDVGASIAKMKEDFEKSREANRQKTDLRTAKKKKEAKKIRPKPAEKTAPADDKTKKEQEKKEMDKLLTRRE